MLSEIGKVQLEHLLMERILTKINEKKSIGKKLDSDLVIENRTILIGDRHRRRRHHGSDSCLLHHRRLQREAQCLQDEHPGVPTVVRLSDPSVPEPGPVRRGGVQHQAEDALAHLVHRLQAVDDGAAVDIDVFLLLGPQRRVRGQLQ